MPRLNLSHQLLFEENDFIEPPNEKQVSGPTFKLAFL